MIKKMLAVMVGFSLVSEARVASRIMKRGDLKLQELTTQSVVQAQQAVDEMKVLSETTKHSSSKSAKVLADAKREEDKKISKIMEECAHCQSLCESRGILG